MTDKRCTYCLRYGHRASNCPDRGDKESAFHASNVTHADGARQPARLGGYHGWAGRSDERTRLAALCVREDDPLGALFQLLGQAA